MPVGRSYQALIGDGARRGRHRQRQRARRADEQQPVHHRRGRHDRPDDGHVRHEPELRGDPGSVGATRRRVGASTAAPRARSSTSSPSRAPIGSRARPSTSSTNDNWDAQNSTDERGHRRVAGARQVRSRQPGLHVHRRRADLEEPRVVLRRVRYSTNTTPQQQTAGADSRRLSAGDRRTSSSTSAARCSSRRATPPG